MNILGISAYYHDSAAALLQDGVLKAAIQEERLSRIKHDKSFPILAINKCLSMNGIETDQLDCVVYYEKPFLKLERIIDTITAGIPKSFSHFFTAIPLWVKNRLWITNEIREKLNFKGEILFASHHESHAAAAFYSSSFTDATIITLDGVGEYATTTIGYGSGTEVGITLEQHFPHSLGLLYSAFTQYCGFKVNSGEYKLMGLAPYGKPVHKQLIYDHLIKVYSDGSYLLNMKYFDYTEGLRMINKRFIELFGKPMRSPESEVDSFYMDVAASIQEVVEEVVLNLVKAARNVTKKSNVVFAGGVMLNCKLNQKIVESNIFENHYFYPCPGDAGSAVGAAFLAWHNYYKKERINFSSQEVYLGPDTFDNTVETTEDCLKRMQVPYRQSINIFESIAEEISQGKIIGWFNGRMEFGPRALGNRSILADPRRAEMKNVLNEKIKLRENFRPFAPAILEDKAADLFHLHHTKYNTMMVTALAKQGTDKIMPAVIHEDGTARIQTVSSIDNPDLYKLLESFFLKTGCPALINTSFNVRGEPIVSSIEDALRTFLYTEIDLLVIDSRYVISKEMNLENIKNQILPKVYEDD